MRQEINFVFLNEKLDPTDFAKSPKAWFEKQPPVGEKAWLLVHADDGIIWGEMQEGQLIISSKFYPNISPLLRPETIQQARLFGKDAEIRVWRNKEENGFKACRLYDRQDNNAIAFDEEHILWGTRIERPKKGGFTEVVEGRQGLRHAVPLDLPDNAFAPDGKWHPLRLRIRHYLDYDKEGQMKVALSRLLELSYRTKEGEKK